MKISKFKLYFILYSFLNIGLILLALISTVKSKSSFLIGFSILLIGFIMTNSLFYATINKLRFKK